MEVMMMSAECILRRSTGGVVVAMSHYWGACQISADREVFVFPFVVTKYIMRRYLETL